MLWNLHVHVLYPYLSNASWKPSSSVSVNQHMHDDLAQHKARLRKVEMEEQRLLQDTSQLNEELEGRSAATKKLNEDFMKPQSISRNHNPSCQYSRRRSTTTSILVHHRLRPAT